MRFADAGETLPNVDSRNGAALDEAIEGVARDTEEGNGLGDGDVRTTLRNLGGLFFALLLFLFFALLVTVGCACAVVGAILGIDGLGEEGLSADLIVF